MPGRGWPKGVPRGPQSPEHREKLRLTRIGRTHTPEARAKISAVHRGKTISAEQRSQIAASLRSDRSGYAAAHFRHRKTLPLVCSECGASEGLEVALRHDAPLERLLGAVGRFHGRHFSLDDRDYFRLCASCHRKYDLGFDWMSLLP